MPKFHHRFTPSRGSSLGNGVDPTTRQIEDAGFLEILQTPGAAEAARDVGSVRAGRLVAQAF